MGDSGQSKAHQLVFECLQKAAGIMLQARVALRTQDRHWFPSSVESVDFVRQYLEPWGTNLHEPLQLDILDEEGALVERWTMHYSPKAETVRERASTISRKIAILLRTLYSFVRILPAFQTPKKPPKTTYQFRIYNPSLKIEYTSQDFVDGDLGQYSFPLMKTPYGQLHIKCKYLRDPLGRPSDPLASPIEPNVIITDYIPDYHGPSRFTVADAGHRRSRSTSIDSTSAYPPRHSPQQPNRAQQSSPQRLTPIEERQMKRASTVGPSGFHALTRRHSSPSPPVLEEDADAGAQPSASAPTTTMMDNISTMPLGIVGKSRSGSRASPKDLPFMESSSPSLVAYLPDPADVFTSSPPFPQLDCTLLSTSPQLPPGLSGRNMTKFLQAAVANQHRQQGHAKQGMLPQAALNASQHSRRRASSEAPPALDFNIPALPEDPFDTSHKENYLEQKDDDPTGQLPFAPEEFEPDDDENQAGFLDYWDNGPFAQSVTGSGLPGLWPLPERNRPQSLRKTESTDCSALEEQLEEFRNFKQSFYQSS